MSVLIGIPAKDEEKTIHKVISEALNFGDVLLVDDGSTDNTFNLANEAGAKLIHHPLNLGYGASISDIFSYAKSKEYDFLVTIDGDSQHLPSEIPNFIQSLKNADVVIGNRFLANSDTPNYRGFGVKAISKLNRVGDSQCGFRAYNKKAIQTIAGNIFETGMGASIEVLKFAQSHNLTITEIPCTIIYNKKQRHTQNPISHGFDLILAFVWWMIWEKPAKTLLSLGLVFLFGAVIATVQTVSLYAQSHYIVHTWALLAVSSFICTLITFNTLIFVLVFKHRKVNDT